MIRTIFKWLRRSAIFGLALIGALALVLTAMMAVPVSRPPMMQSVINTVRTVDRSDMPPLSRFQARDGTELAYRHYPPGAPGTGRIAIVIHGSSGGSPAMHAVSRALAAKGVEAYAVDMRGHGASGTRGDVAYVGQLEDDLADLVRQDQADRCGCTADLDRALGRRRIRAAGRRLSSAERICPNHPAGAVSWLRRPHHHERCRRLGEPGYSANRGAARAEEDGNRVLRVAAGCRLCDTAEFPGVSDLDLLLAPDDEFRRRYGLSSSPRSRDKAGHDLCCGK